MRLNQWSVFQSREVESIRPEERMSFKLMPNVHILDLKLWKWIQSEITSASRTCVFPLRMPTDTHIDVWARGDRRREDFLIIINITIRPFKYQAFIFHLEIVVIKT